jgi:hypothetical protein
MKITGTLKSFTCKDLQDSGWTARVRVSLQNADLNELSNAKDNGSIELIGAGGVSVPAKLDSISFKDDVQAVLLIPVQALTDRNINLQSLCSSMVNINVQADKPLIETPVPAKTEAKKPVKKGGAEGSSATA